MRMKKAAAAVCAAILALSLPGCGGPYTSAEDEIALQIQLDLDEEIGLLVIDYAAGESSGSGGVSNADKSPLKRDELLFYTLERRFFEEPSAVDSLRLTFTVITEYQEPSYENVYPDEYTLPAGELILDAEFGEVYSIAITGGRENGYKASPCSRP